MEKARRATQRAFEDARIGTVENERDDPPRPIDWGRVEDWTEALLSSDLAAVQRVFTGSGTRPPKVIWNPAADDLPAAQLQFLVRYWAGLGRVEIPNLRQVDALGLKPALGYVMLLDVIDDGQDFFYRVYGSVIAGISGFDMTGHRLSLHHTSPYVTEFALAAYRGLLRRREPIYTERSPVGATQTVCWQRLALPLVDDHGV